MSEVEIIPIRYWELRSNEKTRPAKSIVVRDFLGGSDAMFKRMLSLSCYQVPMRQLFDQ